MARDVVPMTLSYKRKKLAYAAAWTDSISDGYRKRDESDSGGDGDDCGQPSKDNTSKPGSQKTRQGRASEHSLSASGPHITVPWAQPIVLSAQVRQ